MSVDKQSHEVARWLETAIGRNQESRRIAVPPRNAHRPKRMESQTLRRRIIALLRGQQRDARDLSQVLGLKEKEVYEHLIHVERSVEAAGDRFILVPSQCLLCGYVFGERRRLTRPGRCPQCRRSKIQNPSFRIISDEK
jgi:transcriptional regulator